MKYLRMSWLQFHMSEDLFPDAPKEDQESLREFTFICMLCLDIYIKKQVIEAILGQTPNKIKGMLTHSFYFGYLFFIQTIQNHIITVVAIIQ